MLIDGLYMKITIQDIFLIEKIGGLGSSIYLFPVCQSINLPQRGGGVVMFTKCKKMFSRI